jgi:hypothetical protein
MSGGTEGNMSGRSSGKNNFWWRFLYSVARNEFVTLGTIAVVRLDSWLYTRMESCSPDWSAYVFQMRSFVILYTSQDLMYIYCIWNSVVAKLFIIHSETIFPCI